MKAEYIKRFEHLGMGLFVHFGLYSIIAKGEWYENVYSVDKVKYEKTIEKFNPNKNWAKELVKTAKKMGAKYITLTTRHHDGFSLYDTCGLSDFDAMHAPAKRDLVREFVDECNKQGIVPFFYHTLLDWHHPTYVSNFENYLDYLRKSVELLCTKYGKIGGLWFDGSWSKQDINEWQFDKLYALIRKYQPDAMIINNTGLIGEGEISHSEIDSVTFERGHPFEINTHGKEIAGEMCDGITDHWGYAKDDIVVKPATYLIKSLVNCRANNCNYLINSGPMGNGQLNPIEKYTLLNLGRWIKVNKNFIYNVKKADISSTLGDLLMGEDGYYYLVIHDVPMSANQNVTLLKDKYSFTIKTDRKILNPKWLDNNSKVAKVKGERNTFISSPFNYGTSFGSRVMRFKLK